MSVPATAADSPLASLRQALLDAHMVPLWESPTAHKRDVEREQAYCWPWEKTRPIMGAAAELQSPQVVERRVMSLVNPMSRSAADEATTGTISATLQMLLPGERARMHRHSMSALRFVLEGGGAATVVDGKVCPMEVGDLIITPAWCWHAHEHTGRDPIVWLDVLDVALHLLLGTDEFQPGPAGELPPQIPDAVFSAPNIVPCIDATDRAYSPVFRYPWSQAVQAVQAAPLGVDGARRVRYANPLTGGPSMPLLDSTLVQFEGDAWTRRSRSSASSVCCVVEGEGTSEIGNRRIDWKPHDVFTLPAHGWVSHRAGRGAARLLMVSSREVYRRLGLLTETFAD